MSGTDNYIDDVIVNTRVVLVERVRQHLKKYVLLTKDPEPLSCARVLGLRVREELGVCVWSRAAHSACHRGAASVASR